MVVKNIFFIFLINAFFMQAIEDNNSKQDHQKYQKYCIPKKVLSQEENSAFVKEIRSILQELGFAEWETVQITIVDGDLAAAAWDKAGIFEGFVVGSLYYNTKWLKAILAHELIHWEKNHGLISYLYISASGSVFMLSLLHSITIACTESGRAGLLFFAKGLSISFFIHQMHLLHQRHQEQEADMVSTKRWGTAKTLLDYMHYGFNGKRYELSLQHKSRFVELSVEDMIKTAEEPSLRDSLHNCLHYLFDAHPTWKQRVAYLYPIAQQQEQAK